MLTSIDFYKAGHREQYPLGTQVVMHNLTPRSNKIMLQSYPDHDGKVVVLLQHVFKQLIEKWDNEFFNQPLEKVMKKYKRRIDCSLGTITFDHIKALHELGSLPIQVIGLPDGTLADVGTPIYVLWNYVDEAEFFWVPNYLETQISAMSWKGSYSG